MREITKTHKIYKFDELDAMVKQTLINDEIENIIYNNFEFLSEYLNEYLKANCNLEKFEIDYSFTYCQGDGCCFYDNNYSILSYSSIKNGNMDKMNIFEKHIYNLQFEDKQKYDDIMMYLNYDYDIKIIKKSYSYSHSSTCDFDFEYFDKEDYMYLSDDEKKQVKDINASLDEIIKQFKDIYFKICDEMEEIGYNCYDVKEEDAIEYLNDFEYYVDGSIYME